MDREEKLLLLEKLKEQKKLNATPDYYLSKQISDLKKELGIKNQVLIKEEEPIKEPIKEPTEMWMKVAVDVAVGSKAASFLREKGLEVIEAQHGETDESWISRALEAKVDLIVSDDIEVQVTANINDILVVPSAGRDKTGQRLYEMILAEIYK